MYYLTMYYLFGNLGILSQMESVERKGTFRVKRGVFGVFLRGILWGVLHISIIFCNFVG